jgi:hypothetical protein
MFIIENQPQSKTENLTDSGLRVLRSLSLLSPAEGRADPAAWGCRQLEAAIRPLLLRLDAEDVFVAVVVVVVTFVVVLEPILRP